jgi:hypothetical protein
MSSIGSVSGTPLNLPLTSSTTTKSAGKGAEANKATSLVNTSNTPPSNPSSNVLGKTASVQPTSGIQNLVSAAGYTNGAVPASKHVTGTLVNTKA